MLTAFSREYVEDIEGACGDGLDELDLRVMGRRKDAEKILDNLEKRVSRAARACSA